ncbi:MAG: thioredoxin family protein [Pseudomonadota bacterium]
MVKGEKSRASGPGQGARAAPAPRHHVQLLVSEWCHTCPAAEQIWRQVAQERDIRFAVVDMAQSEGRELVARLRLKSVPSVIVDGALAAVGVQSLTEARALVADAPPRTKGAAYHAGLMLSRDNRAFIVSAMGWLVVAGALMLAHGGLPAAGATRAAAIHAFLAGFVLMMIFGLAAHMVPRFTGLPIRSGGWAWGQLALAHAGVLGFAGGQLLDARALALGGALALWLALALFAARLWPLLLPRNGAAAEAPNGADPE